MRKETRILNIREREREREREERERGEREGGKSGGEMKTIEKKKRER